MESSDYFNSFEKHFITFCVRVCALECAPLFLCSSYQSTQVEVRE